MRKYALLVLAVVFLFIGVQVAKVTWYKSVIDRQVVQTTIEVTRVVTATPQPTVEGEQFQRLPYTPAELTVEWRDVASFDIKIMGATVFNIQEYTAHEDAAYIVTAADQSFHLTSGSVVKINTDHGQYWVQVGTNEGSIVQVIKPYNPNSTAKVEVLEIDGWLQQDNEFGYIFNLTHVNVRGDMKPVVVEGTPYPIGDMWITPVPTVPH